MEINLSSAAEKCTSGRSRADIMAEFEALQNHALSYLRAKFEGVDDKVFFSDFSGRVNDILPADLVSAVLTCEHCEKLCSGCGSPERCEVRRFLGSYMRPAVRLYTGPSGQSRLEIRTSDGLRCKYGAYDHGTADRLKKSGLTRKQMFQTFEAYKPLTESQKTAKSCMESLASQGGNVILAGRRGTGKSHLAAAFVLSVVRSRGVQARFELTAEMLDRIRRTIFDGGDYFSLIESYKKVDWLVLDDMGKEKQSSAAGDYLFQIIDSRYRNGRPVVVTTNALTPDELAGWGSPGVYTPLISRLMENGIWIRIDGSDYRLEGDGNA